ncbi:MAG: hypothetical protein AB1505_20260 [Candidatus Latescibacterota bacterium]
MPEILCIVDTVVADARAGQGTVGELRLFLRNLVLNEAMLTDLSTARAVNRLQGSLSPGEWSRLFGQAVQQELPPLLVEVVDRRADVGHALLLGLVPADAPAMLLPACRALDTYLTRLEGSARLLRGMRVARIMVDIYRRLAEEPRLWKRRSPPALIIDGEQIASLKAEKRIGELPAAYEARINQLQRADLRRSLAGLTFGAAPAPRMERADYERTFVVRAPLRLGISSANASDNHMRSKEQGARTLNAGIDLRMDGEDLPAPPLKVTARRLSEPQLLLYSRSLGFHADFEVGGRGSAATQSELYFAYRRGGDEALRLVKQALVHTGIVRDNSDDVLRDVASFTGGGGLEITTLSRVLQGSGLGTSSILAAAILKTLYRLCRHSYATPAQEYPALYDQSLLLEQSIGLNSGWQDARGACGGPSAIKDFAAVATEGLPCPERTFLTGVEEQEFTRRVVLFDTGVARAATRGLNVVLDAYLTRDPSRFGAIGESFIVHEEIVAALRQADYEVLGSLATRYWQLRCTLDPGATSPTLQHLFTSPELTDVTTGGLITGAGGGGFALLVARRGCEDEVRTRLGRLRRIPEWAHSGVVAYALDRAGIQLDE